MDGSHIMLPDVAMTAPNTFMVRQWTVVPSTEWLSYARLVRNDGLIILEV